MHPEALNPEGEVIFPALRHFRDFYLAGGTAMALQLGHRVSVDFDLFRAGPIPANLLSLVEQTCASHSIKPLVNNPDELTVLINQVKVTFLCYPFPLLLPTLEYQGIALLSVPELAAVKSYTIGRRGSFKDYVDLYFALKEERVTLPGIIELAGQKYAEAFNPRLFLEQLVYLEDVTDNAIVFLKEKAGKQDLQQYFIKTIKNTPLLDIP